MADTSLRYPKRDRLIKIEAIQARFSSLRRFPTLRTAGAPACPAPAQILGRPTRRPECSIDGDHHCTDIHRHTAICALDPRIKRRTVEQYCDHISVGHREAIVAEPEQIHCDFRF